MIGWWGRVSRSVRARRHHQRLRATVTAYVDGEVDAATADQVEQHLRRCWWCSQDAEYATLIKVSLRHGRDGPFDLAAARLRRWVASL